MKSLSCLAQNIKDKDFFCILIHDYPDGDAIGSAVALGMALQNMGKNVIVKIPKTLPDKFKPLIKYIKIQKFDPQIYISVDLADVKLLCEEHKIYENKIDICIDHHVSNTNFAKINFVDNTAAANCEIIFELLKHMKCDIDEKISECLYTGIVTDTGSFMYSNTTFRTHSIASELIKNNIHHDKINEKLFLTKSIKRIEAEKIIYNNIKFINNKIAVSYITLDEIYKLGLKEDDLDGIASIPISIDGIKMGVLLREKSKNVYKISVRTRGEIDANEFCKKFGGGGHSCAGGFVLTGAKDEVLDKINKMFVE